MFLKIFALKIIYYHLFQIFLHVINGILIYHLAHKIIHKSGVAFITAALFVVSWIHFYELTWIASTFNSVGLLFILLYLNSYLNNKRSILPYIFLAFALLSVETAVIAPGLLFLTLVYLKKISKDDIVRFLIQGVLIAGYLSLRFYFFKIPATDSYAFSVSPRIIKNILVFVLWLFNFPEAMTTHLSLNRYNFTLADNWFAETFPLFSISATLLVLLFLFIIAYFLVFKRKTLINRLTLFCGLWFLTTLLPILFIPRRVYPYYPFLAQIGFWLFLSCLVIKNWHFLLVKIFFIWFLILNLFTISFVNTNHWIFAEASHPEKYVKKLKSIKIPDSKKYVYFEIESIQEQNALNHGLGINILLNDYRHVFFLHKDAIPATIKTSEIFDFEVAYQLQQLINSYKLRKIPIPPSILKDQMNLSR